MPFTAQPGDIGRPISFHNQPEFNVTNEDGSVRSYQRGVAHADLWGPGTGWCDSAEPSYRSLCYLENLQGADCELVGECTCINQCMGRGTCHLGFCHCNDGWCDLGAVSCDLLCVG